MAQFIDGHSSDDGVLREKNREIFSDLKIVVVMLLTMQIGDTQCLHECNM